MNIREMTIKELREELKPYGTPYRLSMKRSQLQEALSRIRKNEAEIGQPEEPTMEERLRQS
jgi:hypothetical protein